MSLDVKALEEELQRDPTSRRFSDLAREYQRVGRLEEALELCEKGLVRHPSQSQGRLIQAQIYLGQGRLEDAKGAVEKILLAQPDHVAANHLAGDLFCSQGDLARALRHYQVVDLFDPGRADIASRMSEIQAKSDESAAEASLGEAAEARVEVVPTNVAFPASAQHGDDPNTQRVLIQSGDEELAPAVLADQPSQAPQKCEPEQERLTGGEASDPALLGGTIRMAQYSATNSEESPAGSVAKDRSPTPSGEYHPEQREPFTNLLPDLDEEFLGADLLDVHEQTLLSLPKAPQTVPAVAQEDGPSTLPRPSVPIPAVRKAVDEGEVGGMHASEPSLAAAHSLNTTTLAELYAQQGFPEKAVEIYQRVLLQDPDQPDIKRKIQDLKLRISGEAPELPEIQQEDVRRALRQRRVQVLEGWLKRVKEEQNV